MAAPWQNLFWFFEMFEVIFEHFKRNGFLRLNLQESGKD